MNFLSASKSFTSEFYSIKKCFFGLAHGKFRLKRFKRDVFNDKTTDYTKSVYLNQQVKKIEDNKKTSIGYKKLSYLINSSERKIKRLGYSPYIKTNRLQLQKMFKNTNNMSLGYVSKSNKPNWSEMFRLDYTAQSLENLRRLKENKVFFRKTKQLREMNIGLKIEGRKLNNILKNYGEFKDYEPYNNSNSHIINNNYSFVDFLPEGESKIGNSLEEVNELYREKKHIINFDLKNTKYNNYIQNTNQFNNKRIENVVTQKFKHNSSLESLINNPYIRSISQNESEIESKTIANINNESWEITKIDNSAIITQKELTLKMKEYELEVYNIVRNLDLNNRHKTGRVEFSQLSLNEILNYIKFNMTNSKELFNLFHELNRKVNFPEKTKEAISILKQSSLNLNAYENKHKDDLQENNINPYIISSMIQKLSFSILRQEHKVKSSIFPVLSYNYMLKNFKNNLKNLNLKNLVDTYYSLSIIHKDNRDFSYDFFQHLLSEGFQEITFRFETILESIKNSNNEKEKSIPYLNELSPGALSFLCQTLTNFKIFESKNEMFCIESYIKLANVTLSLIEGLFNSEISFQSGLENKSFHFIEIGHILNYFYMDMYLLSESDYLNFTGISKNRILTLLTNSIPHIHNYLGDYNNEMFTDIVPKHIVNIVSVFSHAYYRQKSNFCFGLNIDVDNKQIIEEYQNILQKLSKMVILKCKSFEISHASKILYDYCLADIYIDEMYQQLNLRVKDKIESIDYYEVKDTALFTAGVSKFYMREIFPNHNMDVFNIMYPICSSVRPTHARFSTFNIFTNFGSLMNSLNKNNTLSKNKSTNKIRRPKANVYYLRYQQKSRIKRKIQNKRPSPFKEPNQQNIYLKINQGSTDYVPMSLYFMGLMGYKNDIFYNTAFQSLIIQAKDNFDKKLDSLPFTRNIGYIMQTLALINDNNSIRTGFMINYIIENISSLLSLHNSEFIMSQILSSAFCLNLEEVFVNHNLYSSFKLNLSNFINSKVKTNKNDSSSNGFILNQLIIASSLFLIKANKFDKLNTINIKDLIDNLSLSILTSYQMSCYYMILQVLNIFDNIDNIENKSRIEKEFLVFENNRYEGLIHNSIENAYSRPLYVIFQEILINKGNILRLRENRDLKIKLNHSIKNIQIPVYFPEIKLAFMFYDQSDTLLNNDIKGFSQLRELILENEGVKIERIIDDKEMRIIEQESKENKSYLRLIKEIVEVHLD